MMKDYDAVDVLEIFVKNTVLLKPISAWLSGGFSSHCVIQYELIQHYFKFLNDFHDIGSF